MSVVLSAVSSGLWGVWIYQSIVLLCRKCRGVAGRSLCWAIVYLLVMGCTSLFLCYIWSGWVALCTSLGKAGITEFKSLRHAHVSFISYTHTHMYSIQRPYCNHTTQKHIEEWNMLFLTGQTQLTCSSMLQATSGSIHGTLTTPQAKVWCGTHLDMGGAAWNGSNLVKHQTTRGAKLVLESFILTIPTSYL